MNIRYFTHAFHRNEINDFEITESQFIDLAGRCGPHSTEGATIHYDHHTVFDSGVSQICLTVVPEDTPDACDLELALSE